MLRIVLVCVMLWSGIVSALPVVKYDRWLTKLEQPVALTWNAAGQLAILDGLGLRLASQDGQLRLKSSIPAAALDVFAYRDQWWLADPEGHRLLRLNVDGQIQQALDLAPYAVCPAHSQTVGDGHAANEAPQPACKPVLPEPVAVAIFQDVLFWADRAHHRICRYDLKKQQALTCFGQRGEMDGEFQYPYQMAFDRDGYLHVVDILNARIQVFDRDGRFFSQIGRFGTAAEQLFRPNGIAIDPDRNVVYVSDSYFGTISAFRGGEALGRLTDAGGETVRLRSPTGLAWRAGVLYVAETMVGNVVTLTLPTIDDKTPVVPAGISQPLSQKNCLVCHLSWAKEGNEPDKQGMLPEASTDMCYSCHNGAVLDSRLRIGQGAQHASVYDSQEVKDKRHKHERKDKLPDIFPRTADKELPCISCHTPHTKGQGNETLYEGHHNAWLRTPNKGGDICERCHESKIKHARETDPRKRGVNHPLAIKLAEPPQPETPGYASDDNLQKGLPEQLTESGGALGHEQGLICQSCHQIHGGHGEQALTTLDNEKSAVCGTCHERQFSKSKEDARHKGVHPVNVKPDKPMKQKDREVKFITCESCHKVHKGELGTALLEEGIESADALCGTCHKRQHVEGDMTNDDQIRRQVIDKAKKKGVHPVNMSMKDEVEINDSKSREIKCLTCHSVHRGKADTPALVEDHKNGQLCAHCHAGKQAVAGSDHDLRIIDKKKVNKYKETTLQAGVCSACHSLHRGENDAPLHLYSAKAVEEDRSDPDAQQSELKEDKLCVNCHQKEGMGEKKVVKYFNHPHKDMVLRSDQRIMPLLGDDEHVAEFGEIACITCHEPHFWDPDKLEQAKKHPEAVKVTGFKDNIEGTPLTSFLRTKGVKGTFCIDCHGLEAITKFKFFHDKDTVRNVGADYLK